MSRLDVNVSAAMCERCLNLNSYAVVHHRLLSTGEHAAGAGVAVDHPGAERVAFAGTCA